LEIKLVILVLVSHPAVYHVKFRVDLAAVVNLPSAAQILLILNLLLLLNLRLHLHHLTSQMEVVRELATWELSTNQEK